MSDPHRDAARTRIDIDHAQAPQRPQQRRPSRAPEPLHPVLKALAVLWIILSVLLIVLAFGFIWLTAHRLGLVPLPHHRKG